MYLLGGHPEQSGGRAVRSALVTALAASMPLVWTAYAQAPPLTPTPTVSEPGRIILDAVFWTPPGPVDDTCLELPAGQLTVTLQLEGATSPQPVSFRFGAYRYRDADPPAAIAAEVMPVPITMAVPLAGGRYCYAIVNRAGSTGMAQLVAAKMTLVPR